MSERPSPLLAQAVRRGGLADPQADLERPLAERVWVLLALELQRADEPGGARELVEREQPQRVAHDHADAGARAALLAGMAQPAQHDRERGEAEVGLGLAAAGREEQQVDDLAVGSRGSASPGRLSRMNASWNGRQLGSVDLEALRQRPGDGTVGDAERIERVGVGGEHLDARARSGRRRRLRGEQLLGGLARDSPERSRARLAASSIHARYCSTSGSSAASSGGAVGERAERVHRELDALDRRGLVFSTSAPGIHAVRSTRHSPSTISQSADTPWPVAYSGVSA